MIGDYILLFCAAGIAAVTIKALIRKARNKISH
jgi:hypothetical protein